jgi:glutamate-1-semialdehyde 2,1-aminomutase
MTGISGQEREWLARARNALPGGLIGRAGLPPDINFVPTRGQGALLYDLSGRAYVDYLAGAGALILGHSPPSVVTAIETQARQGTIFFGLPSPPVIALAEEIIAASPCAEKVVFTTTGSEATMYAMRFARAYTKKDLILKFEGSYHGNHDFVQVSTNSRLQANAARGSLDSLGVPKPVEELMLVAPFNDRDAVRAIVAEHRGRLAAVIVDCMPRGGVFPEAGFIAALRAIADEFGLLLIFDEVLTGFRLAYGGAQEYFGVKADIVSYGKIIGGGLPLGAVTGPAAVLDLADTTSKTNGNHVLINGTMHGAPVAAAAGLATLRELKQPGVYAALNSWTSILRAEIADRIRHYGLAAIVDGHASYWHVAFTDRPHRNLADSLAADYKKIYMFDSELIRNGVYLLPGGRRLATVAHNDSEMETTLRAVDRACQAMRHRGVAG